MSSHDEDAVLVYGATGTQGGPVARRLLAQGRAVRALVRTPQGEAARALASAGVELVPGDLDDPRTVERATAAVGAVFVVGSASVPLPDYLRHVRHALDAARKASVPHVVLATSGVVPAGPSGAAGIDAKRTALDLVRRLTPHAVVLTTTLYLDNVSGLMRDAIAGGVLPYPIAADVPVAWQSLDDHAACAVAALARPDLAGRRFDLGGPRGVTGQELADVIAARVGHPVTYRPVPPEAFRAQLEPFLGPEVAGVIADNYAWESGAGAALLAPDTTAAQHVLGVTPTPLDAWAARAF